ncbi:MAG: DUF2284 domain-containing protein [Clostridia bacterium]|nr:DUF2284 domain-containing protein [Clostridia bacterium]
MTDLVRLALACGARKAALLAGDRVVLNEEFRKICENGGCGNYGRCHTCPPYIGPIGELMARVRSFESAMLYQSICPIADCFDFEGMMEAGAFHAQISRRIGRALSDRGKEYLHLSGGGCHLCPVCAQKEGLPCRHPDEALLPLEGYGVDVYRTAQATDLAYQNGIDTVTFFGLVLYRE